MAVYSKADLKEFRELLEQLRARLRGDVQQLTDGALAKGEAGGESRSPTHNADAGETHNYEQDFALRFVENEQETLREISEALSRIGDGSYGGCERCRRKGRPSPSRGSKSLARGQFPSRGSVSSANGSVKPRHHERRGRRRELDRHRAISHRHRLCPPSGSRAWPDLWTKHAAFDPGFRPDPPKPIAGGWAMFQLTTSFNEGALFGVGQGWTFGFFALLSLVAVAGVFFWMFWLGGRSSAWLTVALGLILAGTLGNLYDRAGLHGEIYPDGVIRAGEQRYAVRDFLLFTFWGIRKHRCR
ncbi:MAG: hypothetical protein CM1200mP2_28790 [Planctomycetaceae bacterium]|nr:MAG: hypothetical protein CM1200mP2_28790 [Planctomycetaceae bacterium]